MTIRVAKSTSLCLLTMVLFLQAHTPAEGALTPAGWRLRNICVEDHTGKRWHMVDDVVRRYNQHQNLRVVYRRDCSNWRQIVKVRARWYGKTGWAGMAHLRWSDGYYVSPMRIQLNNTYGHRYSVRVRAHIVSHEVGHTLGLDHTHRKDSVMGPNHLRGYASAFDFAELRRRYSS